MDLCTVPSGAVTKDSGRRECSLHLLTNLPSTDSIDAVTTDPTDIYIVSNNYVHEKSRLLLTDQWQPRNAKDASDKYFSDKKCLQETQSFVIKHVT